MRFIQQLFIASAALVQLSMQAPLPAPIYLKTLQGMCPITGGPYGGLSMYLSINCDTQFFIQPRAGDINRWFKATSISSVGVLSFMRLGAELSKYKSSYRVDWNNFSTDEAFDQNGLEYMLVPNAQGKRAIKVKAPNGEQYFLYKLNDGDDKKFNNLMIAAKPANVPAGAELIYGF